MKRLDLKQRAEQNLDSSKNVLWCTIFWLSIPKAPIDTLDLISKHNTAVWHWNFERVALNFIRHCTREQQAGFGVV